MIAAGNAELQYSSDARLQKRARARERESERARERERARESEREREITEIALYNLHTEEGNKIICVDSRVLQKRQEDKSLIFEENVVDAEASNLVSSLGIKPMTEASVGEHSAPMAHCSWCASLP